MRSHPQDWRSVLETARNNEACESLVHGVIDVADESLALPIAERVYSLEDLKQRRGRHGGFSGGELELAHDRLELYALSMSDFSHSGILERELPALAAAAALTGKKEYVDRCVAQLEEAASWSPLQRPGWAHYLERVPMPKTGREQAWLATGQGVRGIVTALEILPEDAIGDDLRESSRKLLQEEVRIICDDWEQERSWFVECHNPITNQWVLPTEGLIRACLWLGPDSRRKAYELGVANMIEALEAHNPEGAFEEGLWYGAYTLESMSHTARAMAVAGDERIAGHPYLSRCAEWMVQCIQPDGQVMNAFDNAFGRRGLRPLLLRPRLTLLADGTGNEIAAWALDRFLGGPSPTLPGLAVQMRGITPKQPPLHAVYHGGGACVLWRSSWKEDASGVWVRGGHPSDQHDHADRGHVSVVLKGQTALMEVGTPDYSHPKMATEFASGMGHNVLQVGSEPIVPGIGEEVRKNPPRGWQRRGVAPFEIHRLDDEGGDVSVDPSDCYEEGVSWQRRVQWSAERVSVSDTVRLPEPDLPRFRWHLAADADTEVTVNAADGGMKATVRWLSVDMRLEASVPFEVEVEKLLDATLAATDDGEMTFEHEHPGLIVRPLEPTADFGVDVELRTLDIQPEQGRITALTR